MSVCVTALIGGINEHWCRYLKTKLTNRYELCRSIITALPYAVIMTEARRACKANILMYWIAPASVVTCTWYCRVRWCRNSPDCQEQQTIAKGAKLTIQKASTNDEGTYFMTAVNKHGRLSVGGFTITMAGN